MTFGLYNALKLLEMLDDMSLKQSYTVNTGIKF